MITRTKTGSLKPKTFMHHVDQTNVKQVMYICKQWLISIYANRFSSNSQQNKIVGCKWICRVKRRSI